MNKQTLIEVQNLSVNFSLGRQILRAVNDISFAIYPGETLGLVGESGSGKSTTGRAILRLESQAQGEVFFEKEPLFSMSKKELKGFRKKAQIIFQDPYASLNPRMSAREIIAEPLDIHRLEQGVDRELRLKELIELVGLNAQHLSRFPHEFSGGQRQRLGIARALAARPKFIVCDEPISALDVSVQAQIINLLRKFQEELGLAYLFITHDLRVVKYLSHRIAVMYLGNIVELATSDALYATPLHPYTEALLSVIPIPDPVVEKQRTRIFLKDEIPRFAPAQQSCVFCARCPKAKEICFQEKPLLREVSTGHHVACHFV